MRLALALSCATLVAGCVSPDMPVTPVAVPAVAWESSFGMCQGYCNARLTVSGDGTATLTESAFREPLPDKVRSRALTPAERARLREAAAASTVRTDTLGCPDCADGGAETVERDGQRLLLEYRGDAGDATPLAVALREIRDTFPRS